MPEIFDDELNSQAGSTPTRLPFPPVTKEHILNCSYHNWHPKYRVVTPRARLISLSKPFLDYLRADQIFLPDDDDEVAPEWSDTDSGMFSSEDTDEEEVDVTAGWRDIHSAIKNTIAELGGQVVPKLNWSAPKDATNMNANTMICHKASEVCLLLKSSAFISHDLENAFDDTVDEPSSNLTMESIPYHLVLRKAVPQWNPSVEFRCFVRGRRLLCMCQRDRNYYNFLFDMTGQLRSRIQEFFNVRLRDTFMDENFVFDVYVPQPYNRVWLVDINPWAPFTDSLLFSWMEILTMPEAPEIEDMEPEFVRLSLNTNSDQVTSSMLEAMRQAAQNDIENENEDFRPQDYDEDSSDADEEIWLPELRLVRETDPEAYSFNSPQYSAHKLPKDVVDASQSGESLREFARDWQKILAQRRKEEEEAGESSDDE